MSFLVSFFSHSKAIQDAAAALGMEATVHLADYSLNLSYRQQVLRWRAKFMGNIGGRLVYTDQLGAGTTGFAGWIPYALRQWPIATDKSTFKHFAVVKGIPTPAACIDPARIAGSFIIKGNRSSFGEGMRGPFLAFDEDDPAQALADGEYFENFIVGHIAKAWCWGDECVALNLHQPNLVTGDGRSSLRQLVLQLPNNRGQENDWLLIDLLAQYCGIASVDTIVPQGKEVLVEYRYGSRYEIQSYRNANLLPRLQGGALAQQFSRAAALLAQGIADDPRDRGVLYTLDAIVDSEGIAWFLEMNCNPLVHPDAYRRMLAQYGSPRNAAPRLAVETP